MDKNMYIPNEGVQQSFKKAMEEINNDYGDLEEYLLYCDDLPLSFFPSKYHYTIRNILLDDIKLTIDIPKISNKLEIDTTKLSIRSLRNIIITIKNEELSLPSHLPKWCQTNECSTDFSGRIFEQIINPTREMFEIVLLCRAKFVDKFAHTDVFPDHSCNMEIDVNYTIEELIIPVMKRIPTEFKTFDWCRHLVSRCPLLAIVFTDYEYSEYIYDMAIRRKNNFSYNRKLSTYKNFRTAYLKFIKSYRITPNGTYNPYELDYNSIKFKDIVLDEYPELLLYVKHYKFCDNIGLILEKCIEMKRPFIDNKWVMEDIVEIFNGAYCDKKTSNIADMRLYHFTNGKYLTLLAYKDIIIRLFSTKNKFHIPEDCSILILDFIIPVTDGEQADLAYEIFENNGNEHARNTVNKYVNTVHDVLFNLANPVISADCINLIITYINKALMYRKHRVTTHEEY